MIFLTAQPAQRYFFWQLELLIRNLKHIGISPENIHVLLAHNDEEKKTDLINFIKENKRYCKIFIYKDTRKNQVYLSSIRPHIISKHYDCFTDLSKETIIYIDSDVLFQRKIHKSLIKDNVCYVSDTRNYIGSQYIVQGGGESLLIEMASVVGIRREDVLELDPNAGGAQYILKGMNSKIWRKIEKDSTNLYSLIQCFHSKVLEKNICNNQLCTTETERVNPWYSDMWALLWNLHFFNKIVKIHKELDFLWPDDSFDGWGEKIILHYTGFKGTTDKIFDKTKYLNTAPWFDKNQTNISIKTCSRVVLDEIKKRKNEIKNTLPTVDNLAIVLTNSCGLDNFLKIDSYYRAHLNISIYHRDKYNNVYTWSDDSEKLLKFTDQYFRKSSLSSSKFFLVSNIDFIMNPIDIINISKKIAPGKSINLKGEIYQACPLLVTLFFRQMDIGIFKYNLGKFDYLFEANRLILVEKYIDTLIFHNKSGNEKIPITIKLKEKVYAL